MTLTPRETQIIKALSEGKILKEIASELGVSEQSIKNQLLHMRKAGQYKNTIQMVVSLSKVL